VYGIRGAAPLPTRVQFYMPDLASNSEDVDFYNKWINDPDDLGVKEIVK